MKQDIIVKNLIKKYRSQRNVIGIYIFGSLAKGNAHQNSDVDIEIIFKKGKKPYELKKKVIDKIQVDLSCYDQNQFIKDFSKYPYLQYAALNYKILYDPEGIIKKQLKEIKKYFKENPKLTNFWQEKEKNWKLAKKQGKKGEAENYFDIMEKLKKLQSHKLRKMLGVNSSAQKVKNRKIYKHSLIMNNYSL